jgi:predicted DNA-binding protein
MPNLRGDFVGQKTIWLTAEQKRMLDELSSAHNKNHSQLLREWIEMAYKDMKNNSLEAQLKQMQNEIERLKTERGVL